MKFYLKLVAVTVIGFIIGMLLPGGEAKATPASYLSELENAGYYGPMNTWLGIGYFVCEQGWRYSDAELASAIVLNTGPGIYSEEGYEIIYIAREHLCPESNLYAT